jgi:hypothetical protein
MNAAVYIKHVKVANHLISQDYESRLGLKIDGKHHA